MFGEANQAQFKCPGPAVGCQNSWQPSADSKRLSEGVCQDCWQFLPRYLA